MTEIVGVLVAHYHAKSQLFPRKIFVKMHLLRIAYKNIPLGQIIGRAVDVDARLAVNHIRQFKAFVIMRHVQKVGLLSQKEVKGIVCGAFV